MERMKDEINDLIKTVDDPVEVPGLM